MYGCWYSFLFWCLTELTVNVLLYGIEKYCDIILSADAGSRKIARQQISYLKEIGEGWFGKVRFYKSAFCKAYSYF